MGGCVGSSGDCSTGRVQGIEGRVDDNTCITIDECRLGTTANGNTLGAVGGNRKCVGASASRCASWSGRSLGRRAVVKTRNDSGRLRDE